MLGDVPRADLATAEAAFCRGDTELAGREGEGRLAKLKRGSPDWVRANDHFELRQPKEDLGETMNLDRGLCCNRRVQRPGSLTRFSSGADDCRAARLLLFGATGASPASSTNASASELGRIIREYLLKNPEVLREAMQELERRQSGRGQGAQGRARHRKSQSRYFTRRTIWLSAIPTARSPWSRFFDYNCGYCRQALSRTFRR